jgi:hypothetical protein
LLVTREAMVTCSYTGNMISCRNALPLRRVARISPSTVAALRRLHEPSPSR